MDRSDLAEFRNALWEEVHRVGGPRKSELVKLGRDLDATIGWAVSSPESAPQEEGEGREIRLVEQLENWGASRDQEGVVWLTINGCAVLNLSSTFRRVALSTPSEVGEAGTGPSGRGRGCPECESDDPNVRRVLEDELTPGKITRRTCSNPFHVAGP